MVDVNTYLPRSVTLLQQRGLAKDKEIVRPYPEHSFGTEDVSQDSYLGWVRPGGLKSLTYTAYVKAKMKWITAWGDLDAMNRALPDFTKKARAWFEADLMIKEWGWKNALQPTPEQAAIMEAWGSNNLAKKTAWGTSRWPRFQAQLDQAWAYCQKELENTAYGPFEELPPQPYLSLLGLANVAQVPKPTTPQGQADDRVVLAFLQKYPEIWLGIPSNWQGTLINI